MPEYKILEDFELEGESFEKDSVVELSEEEAATLEGKVELVPAAV